MSQENVEIVRRAYEAFNRRDLNELAALSHDTILSSHRSSPLWMRQRLVSGF